MNRKRRQHRKWRLPVVAVVCFLMAANASQGMVLCFGAHGHVAIEPVGHRHCDGTIHYHDHDAEPIPDDVTPYFTPPRCDPCVDIPLPLGPPHERFSSSVLKMAIALAIAEPPAMFQNLRAPVAASRDALLLNQDTPLSTIVLQV